MQDQARVVIIGSGIAGSSIAYHLAQRGWLNIVVLDQGPLIGGTSSHAPGLVGQLRSSISLTKMLVYSVSLYKGLAVDGQPGYTGGGSLRIASSKEVTSMRGSSAISRACATRMAVEASSPVSFRGLPGVTIHQIRSRPRRLRAMRLTCRCPACAGLNEPP